MLTRAIAKNWWVLLIRGLLAIALGVLAFAWPGITLLALVTLYGAYCLVDGITAIVLGASGKGEGRNWWEMILVGVLGVAAGVITFLWPGITTTALLVIIASVSIVRGISEIVSAVKLRKLIEHEWLLGLAGAASIAFGVMLFARPAAGMLAMIWWFGIWAIVFGIFAVGQSLRLHSLKNRIEGGGEIKPLGVG
jgi:uncharacterized membrane protein HdeD (DUF308 family)